MNKAVQVCTCKMNKEDKVKPLYVVTLYFEEKILTVHTKPLKTQYLIGLVIF